MQATEILTSLRSEKPNASRFKAPAVEKWLVVGKEKPDNPDQSAVRKARASSKDQANGGLGEGGGAALTTLTSLRSERSGTATETDQEERRHRNEKKGPKQKDEEGGESSADNPDQSAVREARHHKGKGSR